MYINDHLIKMLSDGDIQLKHTRKPEDEKLLNVIICLAFPDELLPSNDYWYYYKRNKYRTEQYHLSQRPKKDTPVFALESFFHPQGHKFQTHAKKTKPVYAWAIINSLDMLLQNSVRRTRKDCIDDYMADFRKLDSVNFKYTWKALKRWGQRCVKVELKPL